MVTTRRRKNAATELALYMNGDRVGTWRIEAGVETLVYEPSWLQSSHGRPISLRFPFTPGETRYVGSDVHHYFENLLPDTRSIRDRLAQRFGVTSTNAFDLLGALGRDCVGALQLLPEGEPTPDIRGIVATPINDADVAAILRDIPVLAGGISRQNVEPDFRISISGAQEKTALLWHEGKWHVPHGTTPTTHIFKLPLGLAGNGQLDLSTSVENEWLCSKIIRAYGLPVADCKIGRFEDQKALVVTRFDRRLRVDGSWIMRLPQEDLCQATGTSYLKKYQADGGPGIDTILELLRNSQNAAADRSAFLKCQIVFWMLAAIDGHAKNFSLRIDAGGAYALTPFYDVLSAYPVMGAGAGQLSPKKVKLAMAVRGEQNMHYRLDEIKRRHWITTGKRNGLLLEANEIIDQVVGETESVIERVVAELPPDFSAPLADAVFAGLRRAARAF
jgi:serine/threonine-protein kinase HipA